MAGGASSLLLMDEADAALDEANQQLVGAGALPACIAEPGGHRSWVCAALALCSASMCCKLAALR